MSTLIKLSSKGQLTLPRSVRKMFPSARYFQCSVRDNEVVLKPAKLETDDDSTLGKVRDRLSKAGVTENVVAEAVAWVRNASR